MSSLAEKILCLIEADIEGLYINDRCIDKKEFIDYYLNKVQAILDEQKGEPIGYLSENGDFIFKDNLKDKHRWVEAGFKFDALYLSTTQQSEQQADVEPIGRIIEVDLESLTALFKFPENTEVGCWDVYTKQTVDALQAKIKELECVILQYGEVSGIIQHIGKNFGTPRRLPDADLNQEPAFLAFILGKLESDKATLLEALEKIQSDYDEGEFAEIVATETIKKVEGK